MGRIFAIKKYAIHDGPNIRTTVFFKGCPLSCHWCHNPEGLDAEIDIIWLAGKCVGCLECVNKCSHGALLSEGHKIIRDKKGCSRCRDCIDHCPALAHESTGWQISAEEVLAEIKKDIPFYDESGGGVTFSGGEPLMQPEFLLELLQRCGELGIHRVVDTSAYAKAELMLEVAQHTDMFLIDLKHMNSSVHKKYTGVSNTLILSNITMLAQSGCSIAIRIPLIGGVNNDGENLRRSADFIASLPDVRQVDLLPYHSIAGAKYRKLEKINPGDHLRTLSGEDVARCSKYFTDMGLEVQLGG